MFTQLIRYLPVVAGLMLFGIAGCNNSSSDGYGNAPSSSPPPANTVLMSGSRFSPTTLTVSKGTTVTWKNNDGYVHTATSDSLTWDTGDIAGGESATRTFTTTGTYKYHCTYHRTMGMTGTIIVN